jgi:hypothetical protein
VAWVWLMDSAGSPQVCAPTRGCFTCRLPAIVRRDLEYFQSNRGRMGLPIGTGIVEGSCKFVVQSRFKRPGSRWSEDGLRWLLALKLMRLNNCWEVFWPHLRAA